MLVVVVRPEGSWKRRSFVTRDYRHNGFGLMMLLPVERARANVKDRETSERRDLVDYKVKKVLEIV
jgi:hypothetical protein